MGLNIVYLGTIWGGAIGILIADVTYFLTDEILSFLLMIPFALIGYILGKRYFRKHGALEDNDLKHM